MIQVKYETLHNEIFVRGIQKLSQTPMNTASAFRIAQVVRGLKNARQRVSEEYTNTIAKQFAELKDGEIQTDSESPVGFKLKEGVDIENFKKLEKDFHQKECTVEVRKLSQKTVEETGIQFTVAEIDQLYVLISPTLGLVSEEVPS